MNEYSYFYCRGVGIQGLSKRSYFLYLIKQNKDVNNPQKLVTVNGKTFQGVIQIGVKKNVC